MVLFLTGENSQTSFLKRPNLTSICKNHSYLLSKILGAFASGPVPLLTQGENAAMMDSALVVRFSYPGASVRLCMCRNVPLGARAREWIETRMDGGLTAIGGFLQQTVGALGLKADLFQPYEDAPLNREHELETILGFAKRGEIRYEDMDQDASIRGMLHGDEPGYILIQFKHSSVSPPPAISKGHMEKIIVRLRASEKKARSNGEQVTGFSLLTNRPLAPAAQLLVATCSPPLVVCPPIPIHFWGERLYRFAQQFGCNQREIEQGIHQGIGMLLEKATHPHHYGDSVITQGMLIKLFTGHEQARAVTPAAVAGETRLRLDVLAEDLHLGDQPIFARQSLHQALSRLIAEHAFVVISGTGGCGKTAALYQWMMEQVTDPSTPGTYYNLSSAEDVQKPFFTRQFCDWAHIPLRSDWQRPEDILDRLEIARQVEHQGRSDTHPILFVGLDAADEALLQYPHQDLRELLGWFWKQERQRDIHPPRATLIVTCRHTEELMEQWLPVRSPYAPHGDPFQDIEIPIEAFSPGELLALARDRLPSVIAERFAQTYHRPDGERSSFLASSLETTAVLRPAITSAQPIDPDMFTALCHPTLWRCWMELGHPIQEKILDGEAQALGCLAHRFLVWFCQKGRARERHTDMESLMPILKEIASHCHPRYARLYLKKDWLRYAGNTAYINKEQAQPLFEEACSAGLIVKEAQGQWRWYHPFIGEYLATWSPNEEEEI